MNGPYSFHGKKGKAFLLGRRRLFLRTCILALFLGAGICAAEIFRPALEFADQPVKPPAVVIPAAPLLPSFDRIVVAGSSTVFGTKDFSLARYNADGSLDTTFGIGGVVITVLGGNDNVTAIVFQPIMP